MKRAEQLQPPVDDKRVEIVWHETIDPRRLRRVGEILADILDNARKSGGR